MLTEEQVYEAWMTNDPTEWLRNNMDERSETIAIAVAEPSVDLQGLILWDDVIGRFYFRLSCIRRPKMDQYLTEAYFSNETYGLIATTLARNLGVKAMKGIHCEGCEEYGKIVNFADELA